MFFFILNESIGPLGSEGDLGNHPSVLKKSGRQKRKIATTSQ